MLDFSVTFLITIINITILFFILRAVLFKPVTKFMTDRSNSIQESIETANADMKKARELAEQYELKMKEAEDQAHKIMIRACHEANEEARHIIETGKQEAKHIAEAASRQIEAEKLAAMTKFKLEAAAIIIAASSKLASKDFSGSENQRYANLLLDEIEQLKQLAERSK